MVLSRFFVFCFIRDNILRSPDHVPCPAFPDECFFETLGALGVRRDRRGGIFDDRVCYSFAVPFAAARFQCKSAGLRSKWKCPNVQKCAFLSAASDVSAK
jgi:hypothetical protein